MFIWRSLMCVHYMYVYILYICYWFILFTGSLSMSGVVYGVLASFFVSLFSVLMKKVLPAMDNSIWKLTYYNNVNAILLFIPLIIVFGEVTVLMNFENFFNSDFWALMILGGTFGFAIGYVTGLQIKVFFFSFNFCM